MTRFGLDPSRPVGTLSKGTRVKVGLVAALAHRARFLLLDEPSAGLDPETRDELKEIVREVVRERRDTCVLLSSHIFEDLEAVADRVVIVRHGRVVIGAPWTKDLRLHGRSTLAAHAGIVVFLWAATLLPRSIEALTSLIVMQNVLLALLWGDWFISREKLKGTVAWLRTLPVTDGELVAAKFVLTAACSSTLWLVTTLLFAGGHFLDGRLAVWAILLLAVIAFGGVSAAVRWRFSQKLGMVVPLLIVGVPATLLVAVKRRNPAMAEAFYAAWQGPSGQAVLAVSLVAVLALSYVLTRSWMRRSDTFKLLE